MDAWERCSCNIIFMPVNLCVSQPVLFYPCRESPILDPWHYSHSSLWINVVRYLNTPNVRLRSNPVPQLLNECPMSTNPTINITRAWAHIHQTVFATQVWEHSDQSPISLQLLFCRQMPSSLLQNGHRPIDTTINCSGHAVKSLLRRYSILQFRRIEKWLRALL